MRGRPKEEHSESLRFRVKASTWIALNNYATSRGMNLSKAAHELLISALNSKPIIVSSKSNSLPSTSE